MLRKVFRNLAGSHLHRSQENPSATFLQSLHSILAKSFTHRKKLHQRFCKRSCRKNLIVYFGPYIFWKLCLWDPIHLPEKHLPEITFPRKTLGRNYFIPNTHFPERAFSRNYTFLNVHFPEFTLA